MNKIIKFSTTAFGKRNFSNIFLQYSIHLSNFFLLQNNLSSNRTNISYIGMTSKSLNLREYLFYIMNKWTCLIDLGWVKWMEDTWKYSLYCAKISLIKVVYIYTCMLSLNFLRHHFPFPKLLYNIYS